MASVTVPKMRVGILGAGGIGSVVGGYLAEQGHDVVLIDPWYEHINAIQEAGLLVRNADGVEVLTRPSAIHFKDLQAVNEKFDFGLISVNEYDATWAAACLDQYIKPTSEGGVMCCFMNGINDDKLAAVAGAERVIGAVMTISAAVYTPGVALRTDKYAHCFKIGELDGQVTERATLLASMLQEAIGPSTVTTNLWGQRWSKLVVNSMNNALAGLTGWKTGATRIHPDTQPVGIQLAAEVIRVARAFDKEVDAVMGLTPDAILAAAEGGDLETALQQLGAAAVAAGDLSRPSFGQDVLKGRRTEIMGLNGLVSRRGREKGVATPFCDKITEIVQSLGVGFTPDPAHVKPLTDMTRSLEGGEWFTKYLAAREAVKAVHPFESAEAKPSCGAQLTAVQASMESAQIAGTA